MPLNNGKEKPGIEIRRETADDITGIYKLTELAFRDRPYADGDEQDVVDRQPRLLPTFWF